jgi:hypothetical protein
MHIIIGIRVEKYFGTVTEGHNCDFTEVETQLEKVIIFSISEGRKFKTQLWTEYGECYSGWTTASWGKDKTEEVDNFECGFTHVPKDFMQVESTTSNQYFGHTDDGDDAYYPGGSHYVNMEYFVSTGRGSEKPITFIFTGKSGIGKSFLASKLKELTVYETDVNPTLNIPLTTDVVVLGNKYEYSVEDVVKSFEGKRDCRIVHFS